MLGNMTNHEGMGSPHHQEKIGEQKPEVSLVCCFFGDAGVGKGGRVVEGGYSKLEE